MGAHTWQDATGRWHVITHASRWERANAYRALRRAKGEEQTVRIVRDGSVVLPEDLVAYTERIEA